MANQRKVLVYSTSGQSGREVQTSASTWVELQSDLRRSEITYDRMKAVIGESKHTLESPNAELPADDFTLFLMPKKTKSGGNPGFSSAKIENKTEITHETVAEDLEGEDLEDVVTEEFIESIKEMSYQECRDKVREIIEEAENEDEKEKVREFFSVSGRNYTQTGTVELRSNLTRWYKGLISVDKIEKMEEIQNEVENATEETEVEIKRTPKTEYREPTGDSIDLMKRQVLKTLEAVRQSSEGKGTPEQKMVNSLAVLSLAILHETLYEVDVDFMTNREKNKFHKLKGEFEKLLKSINARLEKNKDKQISISEAVDKVAKQATAL